MSGDQLSLATALVAAIGALATAVVALWRTGRRCEEKRVEDLRQILAGAQATIDRNTDALGEFTRALERVCDRLERR